MMSTMYKLPKGTRDLYGVDYALIDKLIEITKQEFAGAGGEPLETPVFERTDVLLGKYGEEAETKLIYKLADEGGELLALRYDHTIPFMRYIKENGIKQMRRYCVGKVYRRDQPQTGRYREFIQADFDIYGEKQTAMLAEFTCLNAVRRILDAFGLKYTILINDVKNLKHLIENIVKVPEWRRICPIIDKLDKQSFETLVSELEACGLSPEQITILKTLLECAKPLLSETEENYKMLTDLTDVFGFTDTLVFTNSLARGLDYYTGFIWEIKLDGIASTISAGGRYDGLLNGPCVGISIGISRLASFISIPVEPTWNDIYFVTTIGKVNIIDKMRIVNKLQTSGLNVKYVMSPDDKKLGKVITDCCQSWIRFVVIIGETELTSGKFIIKDLKNKTQTEMNLI